MGQRLRGPVTGRRPALIDGIGRALTNPPKCSTMDLSEEGSLEEGKRCREIRLYHYGLVETCFSKNLLQHQVSLVRT